MIYYNKTYRSNGTPINDIGGSIGVITFQAYATFFTGRSSMYGRNNDNNLLRENYVNMSFIFSMRDF